MAKKETKEHKFVKKPIYPGGNKALSTFVTTNLEYPKKAIENNIQGTVFAKYDIDYKGNVSKVYIKSGLAYGCDEEAERLIKLLKFEVPKIPYRRRIKFTKSIQIHFKFTKSAKKNDEPKEPVVIKKVVPQQVTYTISSVAKKPDNMNKSNSYHYSITVPNA